MDISIHEVECIELLARFKGNGNSRTIRITSGGHSDTIVMYGNTDALEKLPRAFDFRDSDNVSSYREAA